jgi:hypothetical protein
MKFIIGILLFSGFAFSTELIGEIFGELTSENSPYFVTGDIIIPEDTSLYISGEVEFIFQGNYSLIANGELTTDSILSDSVLFYPAENIEYWNGIIANSEISLTCVRVSHTENGIIFNGEGLLGSSSSCSNSVISNSENSGIIVNNGEISIYNCIIHSNKKNGIEVNGAITVDIIRNELYNNCVDNVGHPAILITDTQSNLGSNYIHDNHYQGVGLFQMSTENMLFLASMNIIERNFTGITIVGATGQLNQNIIKDNYQVGNYNSGAGVYIGYSTANVTLKQNTITGNYYGISVIYDATVDLTGNYGRNYIYDNTYEGTICNVYNASGNDILAEYNYWGENSVEEVQNTIQSESGNVLVSPLLGDFNINGIVDNIDKVMLVNCILDNHNGFEYNLNFDNRINVIDLQYFLNLYE